MDRMAVCEVYDDSGNVCCNADSPSDLDEVSLLEIETVGIISMKRSEDDEKVHT